VSVTSDQIRVSADIPLLWLLRSNGRLFAALLGAIVGVLIAMPLAYELSVIVGWDFAALAYLGLLLGLMLRATPNQCAELGRIGEPSGALVLAGTVLLSLVSVSVVVGLIDSLNDAARWVKTIHIVASVLAILTWLLAHVVFAFQYMKIYYDDTPLIGGESRDPRRDPALEYPLRPMPDLWDFAYFSFTLAMRFQTSDVTITSPAVRRVALVHAIFSFFFVVTIIGMVVNVLGNVI
jgi:uncharacterized membrane protein